jgi:MFS family permease
MKTIIGYVKKHWAKLIGRFKPGIWIITLVGFLNSAGFSISLPFIALYLHKDRGLSMTLVGFIILIGGLISALLQIYAGALCDRLGRRPLLVVSVAASALLYGIMALLVGMHANLWLIVLIYTMVRMSMMMQRPSIQAMVVDLSPRQQLAEANGLLRIGQNLGWAAGPALGGYLLASMSYAWLFGVGMLMSLLVMGVVLSVVKESYDGSGERISFQSIFAAGRDRDFLVFTMLCIMLFLAMGQMGSTLSVFSVERVGFTTGQYGALLTLNGLIVVAFQYPVARLVDRITKRNALMIGSVLYALGYGIMGLVGNYNIAILAMIGITMGEIVIAPTTLAVVGELSPTNWRGRYMGFFGLSETIGVSIGPLLGGILLDTFPRSSLGVWGIIGLAALISSFGFFFWGRIVARSHGSST